MIVNLSECGSFNKEITVGNCIEGFSIILISYRHDQYFEDALNSIRDQTYDHKKIQLIIVCKSNGMPINIINKSSFDFEVEIIIDDNFPIGNKFANAVRKARYAWISVLDDDDFWVPLKLEFLEHIILSKNNVGYIHNSKELIVESLKYSSMREKLGTVKGSLMDSIEIDTHSRAECEHNGSSITFNTKIIKYKTQFMQKLTGGIDTFLFVCANISGLSVLCIPYKLTYFRVSDFASDPAHLLALLSNLNRQLQSYEVMANIPNLSKEMMTLLTYRISNNKLKELILNFKNVNNSNRFLDLISVLKKFYIFKKPMDVFFLITAFLSVLFPKMSLFIYLILKKHL